MMDFSKDPREAEKQIQAIIYYLVTFGYIDGDFDPEEQAFVRDYISKIVEHKLQQSDAYKEMPAKAVEQLKIEQEEHYNLVFEQNDQAVRDLFTEVVDSSETVQKFIRHRLKLRCYEIFRSFKEDNRSALMEVIDEFIMADGVEHPAEVEFRNELADLLHLEIMLDMDDLEVVPSTLEVTTEVARKIAQTNHPFMRNLEVHYSGNDEERNAQAIEEMKLIEATIARMDEMRELGKGKLAGVKSFQDLMTEDDSFLDGHVFVIPPKAGHREL